MNELEEFIEFKEITMGVPIENHKLSKFSVDDLINTRLDGDTLFNAMRYEILLREAIVYKRHCK